MLPRALARILVYVSAAGASVALWQRGRLREVRPLPAGEEGHQQFDMLLAEQPRTPVCIVVDTVEEQFRHEILPRAYGADRRQMIQRRLRQLLVQSHYRAALRQGPASDRAQADHYLFMGLTGHESLRPWLEMIQLHRAPLAGIWLAPSLSRELLRRLGLGTERLLLVSEQTGGLRLSYFEASRLRFSRLAPVDNALYENPLEGYGDEIERTRQYLLSQRLLSREDKLKVYLIDPLDSLGELHALLPESAGFQCETIARPRLVADLGLPPSLLAESTDAIYLNLLPYAERETNLQPPEMRAAYTRFLIRRWLYSSGAIWLGLCLLLSAGLLLEGWRQDRAAQQFAQLTSKARLDEQRLAGSQDNIRQLHLRLEQLAAWRQVQSLAQNPARDFQSMLAYAPDAGALRIQKMDWRLSADNGMREMRLSGAITPFLGDYQSAHASIEALAERLRQAGWRASIEQWPLDASAEGVATGELPKGEDPQRAGFRLFLRGAPGS